MKKTVIELNKPVYTGVDILDDSKVFMADYHYNNIKKKYGDKAKLLFTDTDSLTYHIYTEDIYKDMLVDADTYDFSGYPKDHICFSNKNKKVVLKFKDELNGIPIYEFVGLRAKAYSILAANDMEINKLKGIRHYVVDRDFHHEQYLSTLNEGLEVECNMTMLRSTHHNMHTVNVNKVGMSAFDDKRYILDDGISSLAYGHYAIPN